MSLQEELIQELEAARLGFHNLLDSVPESFYSHPSGNPAWTVGDVLFHITLGPPALRFEISMIHHAPWLMNASLNPLTSRIFNWGNALFARLPKRITRAQLLRSYATGHARLVSTLKQMQESDLQKSAKYPPEFVSELAGEVTIERLFRYVREHFDIHAKQISEKPGEILV
jgi:hypothetical protein